MIQSEPVMSNRTISTPKEPGGAVRQLSRGAGWRRGHGSPGGQIIPVASFDTAGIARKC
jgi:hypothetical protein